MADIPPILDYAPADEFDTGRFVARYLQGLALFSIAWMIAGPIFFDTLNVDLSSLVLLALASALKRHSPLARKWVIIVCGWGIVLSVGLATYSLFFGTTGITLGLGQRIRNPAPWQVCLVSTLVATISAIPLVVLLSKSAQRQFAAKPIAARPTDPTNR